MKNQFMPLFWGDFLADTMDLSAQEVGAYFLLIAHAWGHDACVPYDTAQRIARVNNFHWGRVKKRLEPFFEVQEPTVDVVHRMYYHHKVHRVLTSAAEISNKRKDAAMQMHSKSRANGHANGDHLYYTNNRDAFFGEGSKEPTPETTPAEPKPVAEKKPVDHRDPGLDYRSPPKTKSDNKLEPIPERPAFRRP